MLKRKIDSYLRDWLARPEHKPLIIRGARQVGKTESVRFFAKQYFANVVEINFALQKAYRSIFDDGYEVDRIIKNISLLNPACRFEEGRTLLFFDELQDCPDCATSLKSFAQDGRYEVICSGSLLGVHYARIESNAVGYKEDFEMHSMDFEEFLWAKGYGEDKIDDLYDHLVQRKPFSDLELEVYFSLFNDYMIVGGMPAVVDRFVRQGNFSGVLQLQRQLHADYEEDITKYTVGLDQTRVLAVYRHLSVFLAQENKKFRITQIAHGARNREYVGCVEWLQNAGIVNVCYCLSQLQLPLRGNYNPVNYKLYYRDTGLLIASLDEEVQNDLRMNRNFGTYKGGLYENIVADMLVKQGYQLYFYRNETSTLEMDFFVRDAESLIPVEVKAKDNATPSLNRLVDSDVYADIRYGIKLCRKNIGFNGKFLTLPYFLTFLLRRSLTSLPL